MKLAIMASRMRSGERREAWVIHRLVESALAFGEVEKKALLRSTRSMRRGRAAVEVKQASDL